MDAKRQVGTRRMIVTAFGPIANPNDVERASIGTRRTIELPMSFLIDGFFAPTLFFLSDLSKILRDGGKPCAQQFVSRSSYCQLRSGVLPTTPTQPQPLASTHSAIRHTCAFQIARPRLRALRHRARRQLTSIIRRARGLTLDLK